MSSLSTEPDPARSRGPAAAYMPSRRDIDMTSFFRPRHSEIPDRLAHRPRGGSTNARGGVEGREPDALLQPDREYPPARLSLRLRGPGRRAPDGVGPDHRHHAYPSRHVRRRHERHGWAVYLLPLYRWASRRRSCTSTHSRPKKISHGTWSRRLNELFGINELVRSCGQLVNNDWISQTDYPQEICDEPFYSIAVTRKTSRIRIGSCGLRVA